MDVSSPCWKLADSGSGNLGSSTPTTQTRLETNGKKKRKLLEKIKGSSIRK